MCWYWQTCEQKGLIYWNLKCYWYIFVQPSPRINIHHAFCKAIFWPCLLLRDELQAQLTPFPYPTSAIKLSTVQGVDWNWLFFISVSLSSCFFLFHFVFPHFFFSQHRHLLFICWTYTRCAVPFYLSWSVIWIFFERCLGWFSVLFVLVTVNELSRLCWQLKKQNWCRLAFKKNEKRMCVFNEFALEVLAVPAKLDSTAPLWKKSIS